MKNTFFLLSLFLLGTSCAFGDITKLTGPNTNQCVQDLPSLSSTCPTTISLSTLAEDLRELPSCCQSVLKFYNDGCFCNPIATTLIGSKLDLVKVIFDACWVLAGPVEWIHFPDMDDCGDAQFNTHTYNAGTCSLTDLQIDGARAQGLSTFINGVQLLGANTQGLNFTTFKNIVAAAFEVDAVAQADYGLGVYPGQAFIAEYFSLVSPGLNRGLFNLTPVADPNPYLFISQDGEQIVAGQNAGNLYIDNQVPVPETSIEFVANYTGCSTKISKLNVPGRSVLTGKLTTTTQFVSMLAQIFNQRPKDFGVYGICKLHTRYCANNSITIQFPTEQDCVNFLSSLPLVSPVCGYASYMSGSTVQCRAKHADMMAIDPFLHCPHIGPDSMPCTETDCFTFGNAADLSYLQTTPGLAEAIANHDAQTTTGNFSNYPKIIGF